MSAYTARSLAAAILCCIAACSAQRMTTGQRFQGFTFGSDVVGYTNMTKDACDIKAAIAKGDLATAQAIYVNGSNSNGARAKRSFQSWALAAHPGERTYDLIKAYHAPANANSTTFIDDLIMAAFKAGKGARAYSLINVLINFKYGFHEIDVAHVRTAAGGGTNATNGAPHNLDEAWTIYVGGHPEQCDTPLTLADKLAADLGLAYFGKSPVRWAFTVEFNNAYAASLAGNTSDAIAMSAAARDAMLHQLTVMHVQGVVREAHAADIASACKSTKAAADAKDHARSYWDAAAPVLAFKAVPKATIERVSKELRASQLSSTNLRAALSAALTAARMPTSVLGTSKLSTKCTRKMMQ